MDLEVPSTAAAGEGVKKYEREALARDTKLECLLGATGILLAALLLRNSGETPTLVLWSGLSLTVYLARMLLISGLQAPDKAGEPMPARVASILTVTVAISGVLWGSGLALALRYGAPEVSQQLLFLGVGVVTASVAIHAGVLKLTQLTIATVLLPPLAVALTQPWQGTLPSIVGLIFASTAALLGARQLRQRLLQSTQAIEEAEQLRDYLDQRRNQVEKLKVEVKASQTKRDEAELAMRRMAADLGLLQGKSKALSDSLERLSPIDQITGLDNRRHFEQTAEAEWRRAGREGKLMSLVIVEMDGYEDFVQGSNRQTIDAVLKRLGFTVRGFGRRPGDSTARYDDSRIALLLAGCDSRNAERMGENIRKKIETISMPPQGPDRTTRNMSAHVGVATGKPTAGVGVEELFKRAEEALYEAGFHGGNRVAVHRPLSRLRLERWDASASGPLSEQAMLQKLLLWGYDTKRDLLPPATKVEPQSWDDEIVLGIMTGELRIEVEGHDMLVKGGDCLVIPPGVEIIQEVMGTRPVLRFSAVKLQ